MKDSRGWWRRATTVGAVLAINLVLSACGVPTGDETRLIDAESVPYGLLPELQPDASGQSGPSDETAESEGRIALLEGEQRARLVLRRVADGSPDELAGLLLQQLESGPTVEERQRGLDSVVTAGMDLRVTAWRQGVVSVNISGESGAATDQLPIAIAQIVLTVSSVPQVRGVTFQHDNIAVQVPRADGSLTSEALTRKDYQFLLSSALEGTAT